jgi:site-specific DNA-methyltransferase (adenine-specific)
MADVRLILGDCCEVLPTIASASVDCVITDPPYPHIKREYGFWTEAEWLALMRAVVPECMRVLKPTGSAVFVLQPNSERVGRMRTWLWDFMSWVGKTWGVVQDAYWWNYTAIPVGGANSAGLLRPSVKACVWIGSDDCYRNQPAVFWDESEGNRIDRAASRVRLGERYKGPAGRGVNYRSFRLAAERRGGVTPFNLIPVRNTGSGGHSAATPDELCDWWTRYLCPPGGTVLDPFAGSGTTGVAAVKRGCDYVGVERIPKYFEIAERRIAEATPEHPLFADTAGGA